MIHARGEGETFGLSIAEFSINNKPIITCPSGDLEHIKILGEKAILYKSKEELLNIFMNFIIIKLLIIYYAIKHLGANKFALFIISSRY
jgi:hypothetical protein